MDKDEGDKIMCTDYQSTPKRRISEFAFAPMRMFALKAGVPIKEIERRYLEQEGIEVAI